MSTTRHSITGIVGEEISDEFLNSASYSEKSGAEIWEGEEGTAITAPAYSVAASINSHNSRKFEEIGYLEGFRKQLTGSEIWKVYLNDELIDEVKDKALAIPEGGRYHQVEISHSDELMKSLEESPAASNKSIREIQNKAEDNYVIVPYMMGSNTAHLNQQNPMTILSMNDQEILAGGDARNIIEDMLEEDESLGPEPDIEIYENSSSEEENGYGALGLVPSEYDELKASLADDHVVLEIDGSKYKEESDNIKSWHEVKEVTENNGVVDIEISSKTNSK